MHPTHLKSYIMLHDTHQLRRDLVLVERFLLAKIIIEDI